MKEKTDNTCQTCKSLRGEISLTPGGIIYTGKFWQVEHVYPTSLKGWLVCVLKRHVSALHDLTKEEFHECAEIQFVCSNILHKVLKSEKEYIACFAEGVDFNHIHFHIIGRPLDLPKDARGPRVFSLLGKSVDNVVPEDEITRFSALLKKEFQDVLVL